MPSETVSSKPLFIFFLYHSIERIIEVLNFPYYAQHQDVTWYWPKSLMFHQKSPSSSEFNKKSHLSSYPQTPSNYTRPSFPHLYPFPLFLQHSFWSLSLLLTPLCLHPHKNRRGQETKMKKNKKQKKPIKSRPSLGAENSVQD